MNKILNVHLNLSIVSKRIVVDKTKTKWQHKADWFEYETKRPTGIVFLVERNTLLKKWNLKSSLNSHNRIPRGISRRRCRRASSDNLSTLQHHHGDFRLHHSDINTAKVSFIFIFFKQHAGTNSDSSNLMEQGCEVTADFSSNTALALQQITKTDWLTYWQMDMSTEDWRG